VLENILPHFCYDLEDDAWDTNGRRTYSNCENATKGFLHVLANALGRDGWKQHPTKLRAFIHPATSQIIEIEPGGSGVTGHLLHHISAQAAQ
jgi:hypothetical protein